MAKLREEREAKYVEQDKQNKQKQPDIENQQNQ